MRFHFTRKAVTRMRGIGKENKELEPFVLLVGM